MRALTRTLVPLAIVVSLLAGCGSDVPSESQFLAAARKSTGTQFDSSLRSAGITGAKATEMFNSLYRCVYKAIKDDRDLINSVTDDTGQGSTAVKKAFETKAKGCVGPFTSELTKQASASGDIVDTTATTTTVPS